jgi:hypothetical protein
VVCGSRGMPKPAGRFYVKSHQIKKLREATLRSRADGGGRAGDLDRPPRPFGPRLLARRGDTQLIAIEIFPVQSILQGSPRTPEIL